ncbi:hypothetical protein BDV96DRAFT_642966 [Lophiotrema nucula]|uniref:DUF6604 domain-containing protein n=1 Tax=Lophiotrema nucula TaxID=690887 RepID=A0A6A5ZH41_9PLEO|nr:hypothetical protein BDV96DRAFT_642966 [Lophiotrema nucula]
MSRPDWLPGTHARYKADTSIFTGWLAETAKCTGFSLPSPTDTVERIATDHIKSKKTTANFPPLRLTVHNLAEQALHIVSQVPKVVVPRYIVSAAKRAISLRTKCFTWFEQAFVGSNDPDMQRQNSGHEHFIRELEFMVKVLQSNVSSDEGVNIAPVPPTNRYELLDFEDTLEDEISTTADAIQSVQLDTVPDCNIKPATAPKNRKSFKAWANLMFRIQCTLQDFDEIREHIKNVWIQYQLGRLHLITASVVTELAFQLLQKLEDEYLSLNIGSVTRSFIEHVAFIWNLSCAVNGQPKTSASIQALRKLADRLCINYMLILEHFLEDATPNEPLLDSLIQAHGPTVISTTKICFDTLLARRSGYTYTIRDNVTKDLHDVRNMVSRNKEEFERMSVKGFKKFSTLFGIQILTDIHGILGQDVGKPAKRMRISINMLISSTVSYGNFARNMDIAKLDRAPPKVYDEALRRATHFLDHFGDDEYSKFIKRYWSTLPEGCRPSERVSTEFPPFSENPVLSGLSMLAAHLDYQCLGIKLADHWWAIMAVAHLYNALRQGSYLTYEWKNMEEIIRTYTPEYIFYGGRPTDMSDCWRKISLARGISIIKSPARATSISTTGSLRKFESKVPPFTRALQQWMLPNNGQLSLGQNVAGSSQFQDEGLLLPLMQRAITESKLGHLKPTDGELPEIHLLKLVQEQVGREVPGMQIRIFDVLEQCVQILVNLHRELSAAFDENGIGIDDSTDFIPNITGQTVVLGTDSPEYLHQAAQIIETVLKQK